MVDLIRIHLKAGNGGDGRISFLRSRYQPKGGPDGGDGGRGGAVIVEADANMHSLRDYSGREHVKAKNGYMGGKVNSHGADAEDIVLKVPVGTIVWRETIGFRKIEGSRMYSFDKEEGKLERRLERSEQGKRIKSLVQSGKKQEVLKKEITYNGETYGVERVADLLTNGEQITVARPGRGGRGNWQFRSSSHTTPIEAETGEKGEEGVFFLELSVLADIGFVGLPNVGKSTLLSVLTKAKPAIANYPFTTIEPNLGILRYESEKVEERRSLVIADIPGIIEGASEGKGLGIQFLRHIERCKVLVFVLALSDEEMIEGENRGEKLVAQYELLKEELGKYSVQINEKQRIIVIGKADLVVGEEREELMSALEGENGVWLSGFSGEGVEELRSRIRALVF